MEIELTVFVNRKHKAYVNEMVILQRNKESIDVYNFGEEYVGYISPKEYAILHGLNEFKHDGKIVYCKDSFAKIKIRVESENINSIDYIKRQLNKIHFS
jgi:hypothetical protein